VRYQGKIVHLVCTRRAASPNSIRWYVRYVWLREDRSAVDTVLASGELPWAGGTARAVTRACLTAALAELQEAPEDGPASDRE
jgi:hypothetical protein